MSHQTVTHQSMSHQQSNVVGYQTALWYQSSPKQYHHLWNFVICRIWLIQHGGYFIQLLWIYTSTGYFTQWTTYRYIGSVNLPNKSMGMCSWLSKYSNHLEITSYSSPCSVPFWKSFSTKQYLRLYNDLSSSSTGLSCNERKFYIIYYIDKFLKKSEDFCR